jgi:uncharacterized protein YkwD/uncharacterized membrane protein required for colicin V production
VPQNWIDIAILVVVAWNIVDGVRKGFIGALVDLIAFVLSVIVALTLYVTVAELMTEQWNVPALFARPLAFSILWMVTGVVVGLAGRLIGAPFAAMLNGRTVDAVLSMVPSTVKGLVVSGLVLLIVLALPPLPLGAQAQDGFANLRQGVQDSRLASELIERSAGFDRFAREALGDPLSQSLSLLTIRPEADERIQLDFKVAAPTLDPEAEARMLDLVNAERAKAGLKQLVRDPELEKVARGHSVDMLQRGYFAHATPENISPFDRMKEGGVTFMTAGENLALAPTINLAHQGLMDSPGHRANILNPEFGRVGIGVARADGRGSMYTQNFAN